MHKRVASTHWLSTIRRFSSIHVPPTLTTAKTVPTTSTASTIMTATATPWVPHTIRPHRHKSLYEIVNSMLVFQLCKIPLVINSASTLIKVAEKLKLTGPVYFVVKRTFFKHFCGGEALDEVVPTMKKFEASGIASILDLSIEADVNTAAAVTLESSVKNAKETRKLMTDSIDIASHQSKSFIAVKMTAFVPPPVLLRWNNTLELFGSTFKQFAQKDDWLSQSKLQEMLHAFNPNHKYNIVESKDWISLSNDFSALNSEYRECLVKESTASSTDQVAAEKQYLTASDLQLIDAVYQEIKGLCYYGKQKNVRIMMDAEQTYFQRAIDDLAMNLSREINSLNDKEQGPVVFNTYQMYLKDSLARLKTDLKRAEIGGWSFGVKIVRGAYMRQERERASILGIDDPIHENLQNTHNSYNNAIDVLIDKVAEYRPSKSSCGRLNVVSASHNQESMQNAIEKMNKLGLPAADESIVFAQLMGMQDATSQFIANSGYKCYKYIPYGPIAVTIPYLVRRAEENSSVLGQGHNEEMKHLKAELKQRFSEFFASKQRTL